MLKRLQRSSSLARAHHLAEEAQDVLARGLVVLLRALATLVERFDVEPYSDFSVK